jgi:hypothetical protein
VLKINSGLSRAEERVSKIIPRVVASSRIEKMFCADYGSEWMWPVSFPEHPWANKIVSREI